MAKCHRIFVINSKDNYYFSWISFPVFTIIVALVIDINSWHSRSRKQNNVFIAKVIVILPVSALCYAVFQ